MATKTINIGNIMANITVKTILNIEGDQNYESINGTMHQLYNNVVTNPTTQGRFHHGFIRFTMKLTIYITNSNME